MKKYRILWMLIAFVAFGQTAWAQEITWTEVGTKEALNAAIADGAHIRLTTDIPLSAYLKIGESSAQTVAIDLNGHTLSRSNLSSADANGHVIEVFGNGTLTLQGGTLTGGWANNGGGICNYGTLTLDNVTIDNCKATDGGGIKNYEGATLTITSGTISNCRSDAGGGGVVNYGTASISGCTFSTNIATTRGGAIWSNNALTVSNCTFNSNRALAIGGSDQNEGDGGALHINGGTATLTSVTITNNTSKDAGGIYVASGATLNLGGTSTLSGNSSTEHGGGGIVNQGTVNLSDDVSITGNTCKTSGGGIWSNGTLNMQDNVTITGNTRESGVAQNVFLKSGKMITMTGPFTDGAQVAVFLEAGSGKFTSGYDTHNSGTDPSTYFTADLINQQVTLSDGEAMLSSLEGTVYYIEREWDSNAKKVKATQKTVTNFHVLNNDDKILADNTWYVVNGNVAPQSSYVKVEGTAHLIICDGAKLTAAIDLEIGNKLHIYAQSLGSGMIDADGGGIGPFRRGPMGDLYIHGGIINAKGNTNSAGIGTCYSTDAIPDCSSIDGGNVTIYDGTITAYGGDYGAGIGGGDCRNFEHYEQHIKIYGGTVVANGGSHSAGIGNGAGLEMLEHNNDYVIEIFGGNVEAHGGKYGAGIGSGQGKTAGTLMVYGGIVKAYGGEDGAGIGSGERTTATTSTINGGKVFVYGGKVYAYGGEYGAGIGGGQDSNGATVEVNDGYVYADGGTDAAGIGSGEKYMPGSPNGGKLTVNGGHVFADGTGWGAGIGGGEDSDGAEVIINGGIVEAYAGSDAGNNGGCAIGSEDGDEHRGSLTIGDKMMVHAGQDASNLSSFTAGARVPACWFRPYARIEPCDHSGSTIAITDGLTHSVNCTYCTTTAEEHTFGNYGECAACHLVSLADDASNADNISYWSNQGGTHSFVLTDRTLYKDGTWNTLCLPFDVDNFSGTPLDGTTVMTLGNSNGCNTGFNASTGTLTLDFIPANTIQAGHAYIVKWETTGDPIVNPTFTSVIISNEDPADQRVVSSDGRVQFRGIYNPTNIYTAAKKSLYLGDDNKLHSPDADMTLNTFRAYFQLASTSEGTGDVNNDGRITIADVTALVNIILGKDTAYTYEVADVNGDGTITIADVTALVNIILGKDNIILNNVTVTGANGITFE